MLTCIGYLLSKSQHLRNFSSSVFFRNDDSMESSQDKEMDELSTTAHSFDTEICVVCQIKSLFPEQRKQRNFELIKDVYR